MRSVAGRLRRQRRAAGAQLDEGSRGAVEADRQALGYRRISGGDPCAFCAMLVARGGVYTEASAGFEAHSNCGCTGRPVYDRNDAHSERARELQQLWNESTRGRSGDDAVRAFRQAYEGR